MTNFEKIKSMTVEEMADMFDNIDNILCDSCSPKYCEGFSDFCCNSENKENYCHKATLNWLNAEVGDNNGMP